MRLIMPQFSPRPVGVTLHYTSRIPSDVGRIVEERGGQYAALELTPDWGQVREITVRTLRKSGVEMPGHWRDSDVIVPIIHGQAFYLGGLSLGGGAVSFSMKGVNLRTGRPETEGPLSDTPSQSYWAEGVYLPWIDGYVPSDGQAVRQFVPLRGEHEMSSDVARHVGISDQDRYIDAIRGRFFAPLEPMAPSYETRGGGLLGGGLLGGGYESSSPQSYGLPSYTTRGGTKGITQPSAPVGMGAGARMKQRHEHNPAVTAEDFMPQPWHEIVIRLVWIDDWNEYARQIGTAVVSDAQIRDLERRQHLYETDLRRRFGIYPQVDTDVNRFPTAP
jgi:hypothetical protein